MPEVLEQHYRDRMQSIRHIALRSVQQISQHPEAGNAVRAEFTFLDLVELCSDLAEAGQQFMEQEYKRIFQEPDVSVAWLQQRRRVIEELSDSFLDFARSLRNSVAQSARFVGSSTGKAAADRLETAVQRIVAARQSVLERWPVGSDQEIDQARIGGSEEDYLEPEEAFAQIAGVDVATWRQRMEKYKRTGQD